MLYKTLFCLGVTALLTASPMQKLEARTPTTLTGVDQEQPINLVFASEGTKSDELSSRPPRG